MRKVAVIFLTSFFLFLFPSICRAANTYVVPDNYSTIKAGVNNLTAGDTLLVKNGVYIENLENVIPSGESWAKPVTIKAYPGHKPVIKPSGGGWVLHFSGNPAPHHIIIDGFILDGSNVVYDVIKFQYGSTSGHHIRIQNCEVMNAPRQGILVTVGADYNEFINLKIHDNGSSDYDHGIYISSHHNLVEGCEIYNNAGWGVHIYSVAGKPSFNTVRNNKVYDNANAGSRGVGIGVYNGTGNLVYNNLVWGNNQGIVVNYGTSDTNILNNTVYQNKNEGIWVGSGNSTDGGASNNTKVQNNIVYLNSSSQIVNYGTNTVITNNLTNQNPNFVNSAIFDFHLLANSPAINTGASLSEVTTDFDGISRPQGSGYDIGAYEYVFADGGTPTPTPVNKTPTPSSCPLVSSGDFNCDEKINESDLNTLLGKWMTNEKDITGDSIVNESDLNKLLGNWRTQ